MSNDEWIVTMPKLGETVTEGEVTNWLKQVGDAVAFDDPLFEVSTDKVDSEIPSPYDGVIAEILVPSGETVPVGTPLVRIGAAGVRPGRPGTVGPGRAGRTGGSEAGARRPRPRRWASPRGRPTRTATVGADRRGARHHDAQARRDRHRGHHRLLAEAGRRHRRVRRSAVRGVHGQGRLGDPQPVRRRAAGDPRAVRGDRAGRHPARPDRRAGTGTATAASGSTGGSTPGPAVSAPAPATGSATGRRSHRLRPPPTAAAGRCCSRRWCAGWPRRTAWTWRRCRAPASAGASAGRTSRR